MQVQRLHIDTSFPLWTVWDRPETAEKDPTERDTRAAQPAWGRNLTVGYCYESTCKTCCSLGWDTNGENSTMVMHHSSILTLAEPGTQQRQGREPEQRVPYRTFQPAWPGNLLAFVCRQQTGESSQILGLKRLVFLRRMRAWYVFVSVEKPKKGTGYGINKSKVTSVG